MASNYFCRIRDDLLAESHFTLDLLILHSKGWKNWES